MKDKIKFRPFYFVVSLVLFRKKTIFLSYPKLIFNLLDALIFRIILLALLVNIKRLNCHSLSYSVNWLMALRFSAKVFVTSFLPPHSENNCFLTFLIFEYFFKNGYWLILKDWICHSFSYSVNWLMASWFSAKVFITSFLPPHSENSCF